jgi:hypothetical protein
MGTAKYDPGLQAEHIPTTTSTVVPNPGTGAGA